MIFTSNEATLEMVLNNTPSRDIDQLPKRMNPSKEIWESIGFTFTDIGDDVMYKATLPEGWTVMQKMPGDPVIIYDINGYERALFYHHPASKEAEMEMLTRFGIDFDMNDEFLSLDYIYTIFVRDNAKKCIAYTAGIGTEIEVQDLKDRAKRWLNTNYPDWEDPTKYWD